jgi:hypothetical protein
MHFRDNLLLETFPYIPCMQQEELPASAKRTPDRTGGMPDAGHAASIRQTRGKTFYYTIGIAAARLPIISLHPQSLPYQD